MRALARAVAFALVGGAAAASAASGEALGPAERLLDTAGAQSALPSLAMTPDGRHAVTFVAASPAASGLQAHISHGPYWMPAWETFRTLQIDSHASIVSPSLSISRYGHPLVAWERRNASYLSEGIYLRYHDAQGNPVGAVARVDQQLPQQSPVVRTASNGYGTRHIVVWGAERGGARDARARWFDNTLQPLGDEIRIDAGGLGAFPAVDVAMMQGMPDAAVIAYIGLPATNPVFHNTLYLRRMDTAGLLSTPVALVAGNGDAGWTDVAEAPSLAPTEDGGLIAVWRVISTQSGSTQRRVQLRAQRLDATLSPLGPSFAVTPHLAHTDAYQSPDVASANAGGFAIVWRERSAVGAPLQIRLQRFDAAGAALGSALVVAEGEQDLLMPSVALDADGDAVVTWTAVLADGTAHAMRRRYRGDGQVDLAVGNASALSLLPGDTGVLSIPLQNLSPSTSVVGRDYASGITLALQLDASVSAAVVPGTGWRCAGAASLRCSLNAIVATGSSAPALQLRVQAGQTPGRYPIQLTLAGDQNDPQPTNNRATVSVHVIDQVPDAFSFASAEGVARSSNVTSASTVIEGFEGTLQATVTGGQLSINGGAFTSGPGTVTAGQQVRVRHTSASGFSTSTSTTLTIGGVSASFTSTTEAADTVPDAFAFGSASNVARNAPIDSAAVTVAGINAPATISVSNGSYSVDGAAFTSAPGTVTAGQQVRVRHTSASGFSTSTSTTLTIGGVSASFTSTTEAADTVPAAFDFVDVVDARKRSVVTSNIVTVSGINAPATITVSGGGASFAINGGAFSATPRTVAAGDRVQMRLTTPNSNFTTTTATLGIGGVSDVWRVTTGRR